MRSLCVCSITVFMCLFASSARATVPDLVNYQGLLLDPNGSLVNTTTSVALGIWTDPNSTDSGTFRIYEETHPSVQVVDGVFDVLIGSGATGGTFDESLFTNSDRWLEVTVGAETLSPRQRMTSVVYALQCQEAMTAMSATTASDADTLDGQDSGDFASSAHTHSWSSLSGVPAGFADDVDNDTLGELSCSSGQLAKWSGAAWACSVDIDTDTNTTYSAGPGLELVGTSFRVGPGAITGTQIATGTITNSDVSASAAISATKIAGAAAVLNSFSQQAFDSDLLFLDGANNEIGINHSIPSSALDVNGTTRSNAYEFRSPQTYYHFLRAQEFAPASTDPNWIRVADFKSYAYTADVSPHSSLAPLHLPDGADLTALTCYYYDDDPSLSIGTFLATIAAHNVLANTSFATAILNPTLGSLNDTTVRSSSDTTVSGAGDPVDNQTYAYAASMSFGLSGGPGTNSDVRFYGCRVTYNMDTIAFP